MGDKMAEVLAQILITNPKISTLELEKNDLSDSGAVILSKGLPKTTSLVHLKLSGNRISNIGARYIFGALSKNCSVTCLDLGSQPDHNRNRIGPGCIPKLCELLRASRILYFLNLSGNGIGDLGLQTLIIGISKSAKSLISLNLSYNSFSGKSVPELEKLLIECQNSLKELDISGNLFGCFVFFRYF